MIRLRREEFEELARRSFLEVPEEIRRELDNLDVVVEEWASAAVLGEADLEHSEEVLGLFGGVPKAEWGGDLALLPNVIWLFQRPIEAMCRTKEEVALEVRKTIFHEVGHYLGMGEGELERMGYG